MQKKDGRQRRLFRGSIAGMGTNFLLFLIKFFIGNASGSIAVIADSFNNLSDMGSSLVTLIGFQMAKKPSDEQHPFGHGRLEYISGLVVAFIVLLLGVELAGNAVGKIIHPVPLHFSALTLSLLCLSIPVKLALGLYVRQLGKQVASPAMQAAGRDSLNDVLVTFATVISALFSLVFHVAADGYIGLGVSVFVIFSGIGILRDTTGPLLGQAPPRSLVQEIEKRVLDCPGVTGIHDLLVHNYGPGRFIASAHAEVRADSDILKIHDAIDLAERRVVEELDVLITVHLDPVNTDDALTCKLRDMVAAQLPEIHPELSLHDFRIVCGDTHTNLIFDLTVPRTLKMTDGSIKEELDRRLRRQNPSYFTVITFDRNYL
ncbi:MAG: cation transporter [Ruminococcaceae bacterium]|nr:cation transporter [Oscillospiraceae bacterium]